MRKSMLLGPDGAWRDDLWLEALVAPTAEAEEARPAKPVLTSPLPINACSRDSLTLLPGVGKVLAERIDAVRLQGVVFRCAGDLEQVKGIGPTLSARLDTLVVYVADPDSTGS